MRESDTRRHLETGAILAGLLAILTATGLLLSPTVGAAAGLEPGGSGNLLYAVHMAAALLLVAFVGAHLLPFSRILARKGGSPWPARAAALSLLALVLLATVTGVELWSHVYVPFSKPTAVVLHLATTFLLAPPLALHAARGYAVWRRRRRAEAAALAAAEAAGRARQARDAREALSRRAFLRLGAYAAGGIALAAWFGRAVTSQLSAWRLNSVGATPHIPKGEWRLSIGGLVGSPVEIGYDELLALGPVTRRFTHRCVEGWTYTDDFTGVPLPRVLALAGGLAPGAATLVLRSAEVSTVPQTRGDVYTTSIPANDATDDVLVVVGVGGRDLPAIHGGPVRIMSPAKWGYKACKWLVAIEASPDARYRGYWERFGYHIDGDWPGPIFG